MKKNNIFESLFTFKENSCKEPREDFFTEILKFMLEKDSELTKQYIKYLFSDLFINKEISFVDTQLQGVGRYDLVIEFTNGERIVFEHKIDSKEHNNQISGYLEDKNNYVVYVTPRSDEKNEIEKKYETYVSQNKFRAFTWKNLFNNFFKTYRPKEDIYQIYAEFSDYYKETFELFDFENFDLNQIESVWIKNSIMLKEMNCFLKNIMNENKDSSFDCYLKNYWLRISRDNYGTVAVFHYFEESKEETPKVNFNFFIRRYKEYDKLYLDNNFILKPDQILYSFPMNNPLEDYQSFKKSVETILNLKKYKKLKTLINMNTKLNLNLDFNELKRGLDLFDNIKRLISKLIYELSGELNIEFEKYSPEFTEFSFFFKHKKKEKSLGIILLDKKVQLFIQKDSNKKSLTLIGLTELLQGRTNQYASIKNWFKEKINELRENK